MTQRGQRVEHAPLGLAGEVVVLHASFRSLSQFRGAPSELLNAWTAADNTVVAPSFYYDSLVAPPAGTSVFQNGFDDDSEAVWDPPVPFEPGVSQPHRSMGALAHAVAAHPQRIQTAHPICAWSAIGKHAEALCGADDFQDPYRCLRNVLKHSGKIVLLGTKLTSCTLLHLAEENVGRRAFVRWVKQPDGHIEAVRAGGCSDGFENLWPKLERVFEVHEWLGASVRVANAKDLLSEAEQVFSSDPELSRCSPGCARCRDAILGGPIV